MPAFFSSLRVGNFSFGGRSISTLVPLHFLFIFSEKNNQVHHCCRHGDFMSPEEMHLWNFFVNPTPAMYAFLFGSLQPRQRKSLKKVTVWFFTQGGQEDVCTGQSWDAGAGWPLDRLRSENHTTCRMLDSRGAVTSAQSQATSLISLANCPLLFRLYTL